MAIPTSATYSLEARVHAHTALLALIDAGGAANVKIRGTLEEMLATVTLTDPAGSVNLGTGQLTLTPAAPAVAAANGTAAYAEICDSTGDVVLALPAQAGTAAVSGKIVINSLSIAAGTEVSLLSAVIG